MNLLDRARELGFHRAAIVPIEPPRRHALYASWLAAGHADEMTYLADPDHVDTRGDLRTLLATARTLVVVALAYGREDPVPPAALVGRGRPPSASSVPTSGVRGKIARYARGEDYHL